MPSRPKKKLLAESSSVDPSISIIPPTRDNSNLPNSIIVHRIDPDHYATNASRSSPSSKEGDPNDTDGDNETEAEPDAEAEDRNSTHHTVRFDTAQQQTPSHNNHQLANINVSSSPQPSSSSPSAPFDFGALTKRALQEAGSGLGGAIFSACCVYPIDLVKTRLQLPNSPYASLLGGMSQIIREEGIMTLYTGLASELVKTSVQNFFYFFWYMIFKEAALEYVGKKELTRSPSPSAIDIAEKNGINAFFSENGTFNLDQHRSLCKDANCFCHSIKHIAAHLEAHNYRVPHVMNQVELWRLKAELHRRKSSRTRRHLLASDFDTNLFHPRLMPSVSEPHIAGMVARAKPDIDDAPYVDVENEEKSSLVTDTARLLTTSNNNTTSPSSSTMTHAPKNNLPSTSPPASSPPPPHQQLSVGVTLLLGTLAGCLTQIVVNPISVIQTRMMTQKKAGSSVAAAGFFALANTIAKEEGVSAFFAGILPAFILSTNPSIQFLVFDRLKALLLRILSQSMVEPRSLSIFESFILGAFSKIVATLVTYPYIMAKIRLQYKGDGKSPVIYKGTLDVIFRTLKYEGFTGLFSGLQAQLLKSVLGAALMFMAKEKLGDIVVFIKRRFAQYQASQAPKNNSDATDTAKPTTSSESDPTKLIK